MIVLISLAVLLASCGGGGSDGTTYWKRTFSVGAPAYLKLAVDGSQVSGWAEYTGGQFQHFDGQKDNDGTLEITAYNGTTLTIDGDKMVGVDSEATQHWTKVAESDYDSAGGP